MFLTETAQLEKALLPLIESRNAFLIELALKKSKYGKVIEVFIDTESGVTSELCAEISREFAKEIDHFEFLQGRYNLVVSSPGLDRPLKFPKQYVKHIGRELVIKRNENGVIISETGKLEQAGETGCTVKLKNGQSKEFSFSEIIEAKVKPQW